jgi:catechol 2,3-dioxygenase-like lactoylglutathione lyase family enzyme
MSEPSVNAASFASPLVRTAILVRNLERSVRFYAEVLGLEETRLDATITDPRAAGLLGHPGDTIQNVRIIKSGGPPVGMIGLFEIDPLQGDDPIPSGSARAGETCLVFYVRDLADLEARLAEAGAEIVGPATDISIRAGHSSREMIFRDPDGVLINCIERTPGAVWEGYVLGQDQ